MVRACVGVLVCCVGALVNMSCVCFRVCLRMCFLCVLRVWCVLCVSCIYVLCLCTHGRLFCFFVDVGVCTRWTTWWRKWV